MKNSKHVAIDSKGNSDEAARAKKPIDLVELQDVGPWMRDDSKEADSVLLAEQHGCEGLSRDRATHAERNLLCCCASSRLVGLILDIRPMIAADCFRCIFAS